MPVPAPVQVPLPTNCEEEEGSQIEERRMEYIFKPLTNCDNVNR